MVATSGADRVGDGTSPAVASGVDGVDGKRIPAVAAASADRRASSTTDQHEDGPTTCEWIGVVLRPTESCRDCEREEKRKKGKTGNKHGLDMSFDPLGILAGVRRLRRKMSKAKKT
jgi:hypothetical protein